jgi:hypothetical protein
MRKSKVLIAIVSAVLAVALAYAPKHYTGFERVLLAGAFFYGCYGWSVELINSEEDEKKN